MGSFGTFTEEQKRRAYALMMERMNSIPRPFCAECGQPSVDGRTRCKQHIANCPRPNIEPAQTEIPHDPR